MEPNLIKEEPAKHERNRKEQFRFSQVSTYTGNDKIVSRNIYDAQRKEKYNLKMLIYGK